jgi:beta-lactamase class A
VFADPQVAAYLASRPGTTTAALYDLDNGRTYLYHPGVAETTASIIKVDILETMLYDSQKGTADFDTDDQQEATTMIENSDDNAASALWAEVGGHSGVGAFNAAAGLTATDLNDTIAWGLSTTTAADQIKVLSQLVQTSSLLDAASQHYILNLMENVEADQRWGVDTGIPTGVTVAIKDGWDPLGSAADWQINTEGWVDGDGRDYLLAVLTWQEPNEYDAIQTVDGLSSLMWTALAPTALNG